MNTSILKPSLRTIKTGLAIALAVAIAKFFHLEAPFIGDLGIIHSQRIHLRSASNSFFIG